VLEDRLRAHPLVSQCIVVGDQKPFIAALLTIDAEMLPAWAKNNGLPALTVEQARTNDVVLAELQKAVDDANTAVSKAESIRKFAVLPGDFTEENGYLTPSLKLKRNVVMKDFHDDVEALYAPAASRS
jgi:long-chain acyl-CoA synthetase